MEKTIKETTRLLAQGVINRDEADKILLGLFGVVSRFSRKEVENVLRKVKKVRIKDDLKNILKRATGESYESRDDKDFLNRYTGKEVNVYEWCGDWWICEDDNYVITEDCFSEL